MASRARLPVPARGVVLNGFATSEAVATEVAAIESDFGVSAIHLGADMAKPDEIAALMAKALDAFGRA